MKIRILKEQVRQIIKEELALLTEGDNFDPTKIQQDIDSAGLGQKLDVMAISDRRRGEEGPAADWGWPKPGVIGWSGRSPQDAYWAAFGGGGGPFPSEGFAQGAVDLLNQPQSNYIYVVKPLREPGYSKSGWAGIYIIPGRAR